MNSLSSTNNEENIMQHTNRPAIGEVIKLSKTSPVSYIVESINRFGDLTARAVVNGKFSSITTLLHADTKIFKVG